MSAIGRLLHFAKGRYRSKATTSTFTSETAKGF